MQSGGVGVYSTLLLPNFFYQTYQRYRQFLEELLSMIRLIHLQLGSKHSLKTMGIVKVPGAWRQAVFFQGTPVSSTIYK